MQYDTVEKRLGLPNVKNLPPIVVKPETTELVVLHGADMYHDATAFLYSKG